MGHSPELLDELNTHLEDGAPIAATSCSPPVTALRSPATLPHPRPRPDTRSQSVMSQLQRPTHDFRPAPVSWLLAGGSDLRSAMDSMHDSLIHTTHSYLALPDADHATSTPSDASPTTRTPTQHGGVCTGGVCTIRPATPCAASPLAASTVEVPVPAGIVALLRRAERGLAR
jgi:hypothetical protein